MTAALPDNEQLRLARRPAGLPVAEDFLLLHTNPPRPAPGEVLVEVKYLSLDPAMRPWMDDRPSYLPPVALGAVMRALGAGVVVESRDPGFAAGDQVVGLLGAQRFACPEAAHLGKVPPGVPLPLSLSVLGMPGFTAYFGLKEIGRPQPGETLVVSAASGAVGSVVGQLGKIAGCRVVGIAGGAAKCATLRALGFDEAIDYKAEDVPERLREACPKGIDLYFDNVGGAILDACLARLAPRARVVICGAISQYNATTAPRGPANYLSLLVNRARMEGFIVSDYMARYGEAAAELGGYLRDGRLISREDIVEGGLAQFVPALNRLFSGGNDGKLILKL